MADSTHITKMRLVDWLDDLSVRFLLNLPAAELSSVPRLCFQVEEAQWFYEDFIRPVAAAAGNPLPSLTLRSFCLQLFQHCPLLNGFTDAQHIAAYEEFLAYKVRVPVRGAILLDEDMEKVLLVKGWKKGSSWSFPRGKINKDEADIDCAVREVYEETGYNMRAAGLVPDGQEDGVKYIDVTMREQHMRLFVFRSVPLDTHFEPMTRKEISKIDWYPIRELPGFKKQKSEQAAQANKFYMVAPFLGPLKKWINQQRRMDAQQEAQIAAPGNAVAHAHIEPEEESDAALDGQAPGADYFDKSDELKRFLSVGTAPVHPLEQQQPQLTANGANLLTLLQGGLNPTASANEPQTPLEQISALPQQPVSPHPHHPRHPTMGFPQVVPQFPFSPQNLQRQPRQQPQPQQRNPAPGAFSPGPGGFSGQERQQSFGQKLPGYAQQQQFQEPQRQSIAGVSPPVTQFGRQNGMPFNSFQTQHVPSPPMSVNQPPQPSYQRSLDAFGAQGPRGAISNGPSVPKAENLPMPSLNQHSMDLLNAFKSGGSPSVPTHGANQGPRQANQHQAALLDLFRKPAPHQAASAPAAPAKAERPSPSPTTDTVARPGKMEERRPTLSMITRTLPAKPRVTSPPTSREPARPTMQAAIPPTAPISSAKSKQLYDPANPKQFVRASAEAGTPEQGVPDSQITATQRPPSQRLRSPKPGRLPTPKQASPGRPPATKGSENGTPTPPFTILARPGSARASSKSPALSPSSPLRNETPRPIFQPQVLKRPESVDPATVQKVAEAVEENDRPDTNDKRDQLLALFGRTAVSSPPPPSQAPALQAQRGSAEDRKSSLLNLFNSPPPPAPAQAPSPALQAPQPPRAPQILPERKPSNQAINRTQTPQTALLDLFNKPPSSNAVNSPGTPISPFSLGTPVQKQPPVMIPGVTGFQAQQAPNRQTSRLNSMSLADDEETGVQKKGSSVASAGTTTPVEAKGFLLNYLNGVVQNEGGYGGARRG